MLMGAAEKTETFCDPSSGLICTFIQWVDFCTYPVVEAGQ